MVPVQDKWRAEYQPTFDDIEIYLPEETWDDDQPHDMPTYHRRGAAGLWTALASLAVALAVIAAYGYSVMSRQNSQLTWLPSLMKSVSSARQRTNGIEAGLKQWSSKQENLAARVHKLDAGWKSGLSSARLHVVDSVNNAYQKEQQELNRRTADLKAQLAELTSHQQAEQTHVAELERELADTRRELASVRENANREVASLQQQQISNQRAISTLDDVLSADQVNFEAGKNQDAEIMPGISLHLIRTDTGRQRFGGWIWLAGSRRRLWFRRQVIDSPVVFYPGSGAEAYELVVTRIGQKEVAGYMLVPSDSKSRQVNVASNTKSITQAGQSTF